jgi:hypothetical protein
VGRGGVNLLLKERAHDQRGGAGVLQGARAGDVLGLRGVQRGGTVHYFFFNVRCVLFIFL